MAILWVGILLGAAGAVFLSLVIRASYFASQDFFSWFFGLRIIGPTSDWISVISGVGGALLGAMIGAVMSYWTFQRQQFESQLTAAHSVRLKAAAIYNSLYTVLTYVEICIQEANAKGLVHAPLWMKIRPMVGIPEPVKFEPTELIFLAKAREYELLGKLTLLESKYRRILDGLTQYSITRAEMKNVLQIDSVDEGVFHGTIDEITSKKSLPWIVEVNSLIAGLLPALKEDVDFARIAHDQISPAARKYFGASNFPHAVATKMEMGQ